MVNQGCLNNKLLNKCTNNGINSNSCWCGKDDGSMCEENQLCIDGVCNKNTLLDIN